MLEQRKECPMCGEWMRLRETQAVTRLPGDKVITRSAREWSCPECDYFEEAEEEGA
jgi:hypothetical protein